MELKQIEYAALYVIRSTRCTEFKEKQNSEKFREFGCIARMPLNLFIISKSIPSFNILKLTETEMHEIG